MTLALAAAGLAMTAPRPASAQPPPRQAGGSIGAPSRDLVSAQISAQIDDYVRGVMERMHVPGLVVAVVRGGKVEKLTTYGQANLEWQLPVTSATRFQIASSTKIFTATLVMQLVQEGKLALDAKVARYLPDAPEAWKAITIAHLAAHTSGIANVFDPKLPSVAEAYAKIREQPLEYAAGAKDSYVSGDFVVLSQILERITGRSFPALLEEKLAKPLGMTCTTFEDAAGEGVVRTAKVVEQRASVYRWDAAAKEQRLQWFLYPAYTYAMGGAFSCVDDLVKWARAMDEGKLVTAEGERRAATAFRLTDGRSGGFGVGFSVGTQRGKRRMSHSGGPALADVVRLPDEKLTVIVLANQHRMNPVLAGTIAGLLLPAGPVGPASKAAARRDGHPAWSERLRLLVRGLGDGSFAEDALAPARRDELGKALREWGPVIAGMWPALEGWTLVEERRKGQAGASRREGVSVTRTYRAMHGPVVVRWRMELDADGRLVELDAQPD